MYQNNQIREEVFSKKIYLVDQSTWLPWLNIIKAKASRGCRENVWKYIDPDRTIQPELPTIPEEPQPRDVKPTADTILDLDSDQFAKFQYLERRHSLKVNNINQILHSIQDIDSYIMGSIQYENELWTRDITSTWSLLRALKKRLSPTEQFRKVEVTRAYNELKKFDKRQTIDKFLYEWERIYGLAVALNLPDVMEERPLYDFALAIRPIDETYATNLELRVDENVRQRVDDSTVNLIQIENVIEEFRHFYNRHKASETRIVSAAFTASTNSSNFDNRKCVCGDYHPFKECLYLNPGLRPLGWIGKDDIYHQINQALADPRRIRIKTLITKSTEYDGALKGTGQTTKEGIVKSPSANIASHEDETQELENFRNISPMNFATLAAVNSIRAFKDSWILDGGSDIHICNDSSRWDFQEDRRGREGEVIRSGNSVIQIEAYGRVQLKVDTPLGRRHITLKNVALAHGFLTNIISMQLLNSLGFHWNSRKPNILEFENGSQACTLYQNGGHILFNNPFDISTRNTALMARLNYNPKLRTLTESTLHRILSHANPDVLSKICGPEHGINIDRTEQAPKTKKCISCSLTKSKNIISRVANPEIPRSGLPFHTLCWDAIVMEEAYNGDRYISHFYCPDSHFNFVFSCRSKTEFKLTIRTVLKLIERQWNHQVYIFKLDGETSLIQECKTLVSENGIVCQVSAANTPEQNGAAERSGGVIIVKARTMSLEASIPTNMWPETINTAGYIANRTPIRQLGWKTPFEIVHGVKPNYAHLHIFGCRAFVLNKNVPHSMKLIARAHLGHLVGYDTLEIYKAKNCDNF